MMISGDERAVSATRALLVEGAGFAAVDLGKGVTAAAFVDAVERHTAADGCREFPRAPSSRG
jgi:hypothetical protein